MTEVHINSLNSDDQSVSDVKDEKRSKTVERELSDDDLPRYNFRSDLPVYRKKVVVSNRDADNAAKPELKLRSRLGAAKTGLSDHDLSRFNFLEDLPTKEEKYPVRRYGGDWDPGLHLYSPTRHIVFNTGPSDHDLSRFNFLMDLPTKEEKYPVRRYDEACDPVLDLYSPTRYIDFNTEERSDDEPSRYNNLRDLLGDGSMESPSRYDGNFGSIPELNPINRLNAVKTGGLHSVGDLSSEDESDWVRKIFTGKYSKARRKEKTKKWVIDHDAWTNSNGKDFRSKAECLLLAGKLPTQALLDEACVRYKRTNPGVQSICNSICCYIKDKSRSFLDVWAAYRYNKDDTSYGNKVVFVILTDSTHDVEITEFETYKRNIIEITRKKENDAIKIKENEDPPNSLEIEYLESCLKENAKSQIERHSNLTRVTASWYQSSGYGTEKFKLQRLPCIALYVHVKGFVPLDEEPFSSEIGKYPVDVREGVSILCGKPYDYHRNVKMGCAIRGPSQGDKYFGGTLGPFLEFKDDTNLYAISCAHVFFHGENWKYLTESNQIAHDINEPAFQPPLHYNGNYSLGNVEMAVYRKGGNGYPGMEIALIKINPERYPDTGSFPDDPALSDRGFGPLEFFNGRCCLPEHLSFRRSVYKYGCTTGQTMGKCRINGASVRTRVLRDNLRTIILHDQIEIEQVNDIPFADEGDSGAVVLTDHGNERIAVGIFEGKDEDVYLMTPISPILKELERQKDRGCRLKKFETYNQPVVDPRFDENGLKQILEQNFEGQVKLRNEFESFRNQMHVEMQQGFKNMTENLNQQLALIQNTFQTSHGHNSS